MSLSEIRSAICEILSSVSGVENVYPYLRWSTDWKAFFDLFRRSDGSAGGWMVTRSSTGEERAETAYVFRRHEFRMFGFLRLNDAQQSELVFQDQVEAICDAFRSNYSLNGTALNSGPISVDTVENRMFGSVLVHWAELTLPVLERRPW